MFCEFKETGVEEAVKQKQKGTNLHQVHVGDQVFDFLDDLGFGSSVKLLKRDVEDSLFFRFLLQGQMYGFQTKSSMARKGVDVFQIRRKRLGVDGG